MIAWPEIDAYLIDNGPVPSPLLLRYGAVTPLRAELPDDELEWLEETATAWEAGRLRQLVGGFGDALAKLRDPAQLLVQVELVVLGGVPSAEPSSAGVSEARREGPPRAALPFTPARASRTTPSVPAAPAPKVTAAPQPLGSPPQAGEGAHPFARLSPPTPSDRFRAHSDPALRRSKPAC